jgi:hypothetical protein
VVRPDGSILDQFGYDAATQLYYANGEKLALQVPDNPTREDAKKAAEYIFDEVFSDFPFKDTASKANMMAALITVIANPLIDGGIPLGLFDKPRAGTGAGLLTEVIAEIATGKPAHFQTAPASDEEWRKAITSTLLNAPSIVTIDNVEQKLRSPKLSQMLTYRATRRVTTAYRFGYPLLPANAMLRRERIIMMDISNGCKQHPTHQERATSTVAYISISEPSYSLTLPAPRSIHTPDLGGRFRAILLPRLARECL